MRLLQAVSGRRSPVRWRAGGLLKSVCSCQHAPALAAIPSPRKHHILDFNLLVRLSAVVLASWACAAGWPAALHRAVLRCIHCVFVPSTARLSRSTSSSSALGKAHLACVCTAPLACRGERWGQVLWARPARTRRTVIVLRLYCTCAAGTQPSFGNRGVVAGRTTC